MLLKMHHQNIYDDAWLINKVIAKRFQNMIELPYKDSAEYIQRVGTGIFQGVFDTAVYIMDLS